MISVVLNNFHPKIVKAMWNDESWIIKNSWTKSSSIELYGTVGNERLMIFGDDFTVILDDKHLDDLKTQLLVRG